MPCFNAYFEQEIIRNTQLNFKSVHKTGDIRDYAGDSKSRVIKCHSLTMYLDTAKPQSCIL